MSRQDGSFYGRFWPFFTVKEVLNVTESNFRFAPESRRSECSHWDRAECLLMAESRHWLTVNMHAYARYANDCLWPKADIETESKWVFLNVRFRGKSGHSEDAIRLLIRVFSTVGVCSDSADKAKPA